MMKRLYYLFLLLAAGCVTLGLPTPQTFNERVLAAYASVSAVRDGADALLVAHKISSADAENVQKQADNVRAGIDIARTMASTDPAAAQGKLTSTLTILTALQAYLATKKGT